MTAREAAAGLRKALESLRCMPTPPRWNDSEGGPINAVDCAEQAIDAALVVLDAQAEREARGERHGHDEPCFFCGEPCNHWAGNPGRWPVALCHSDNSGIVKWHHSGCVTAHLDLSGRKEGALAVLAALTTCYRCEGSLHLDGPVRCEDGCEVEDEEAADDRQREYAAVIEGWALAAGSMSGER